MLPIAEILAGVQDSLESLAGHAGLLIMNALLEDEVDQLVERNVGDLPMRELWSEQPSNQTCAAAIRMQRAESTIELPSALKRTRLSKRSRSQS